MVAEGRLLGQWRDELTAGAPGRGLPPLAPNVEVLALSEHGSIAGQIRAFDRALGERPGVVLAANSLLDRYPADLQTIPWHLLVADEALRYVNPATDAHRALAQVRFGAAADCWLLTATPRGKSAEHLDVLVGLAVGDEAMIRERLNTREAGNLLDEINAHRLRVNYGPHLVRVTRQDMAAWMPDVRPAEPLAIEPDAALAELLEAIRHGGRQAYRRLLGVAARAQGARARQRALPRRARRALARAGDRALQRQRVRRRLRRPRDAHAQPRRARAGARRAGPGRRGDARRRRRPAAAARHHRADDRARRRRGADPRVRRAHQLPAPARRARCASATASRRTSPTARSTRPPSGGSSAPSRPASSRCSASAPSRARGTTSRTPR